MSLLVTAGASQLVKSLISGRTPSREDFGGIAAGAVEELLGAVLAAQQETARTLSRLEEKVDRLASAFYRTAVQAGYRNLSEARYPHRRPEDRRVLIDNALQDFITAGASARQAGASTQAVVHTEILIAAGWLAKGYPVDFHATTASAGETVFAALLEANESFRNFRETVEAVAEARRSFTDRMFDTSPDARPVWVELYREVERPRNELAHLFNEIQGLRRTYGAAAHDTPRIVNFLTEEEDRNEVFSVGEWLPTPELEQPARIAGVEVTVYEAAIQVRLPRRPKVSVGEYLVDATLEIAGADRVQAGGRYATRGGLERESLAPHEAGVPLLLSQHGLLLWNGEWTRTSELPRRVAYRGGRVAWPAKASRRE